MTAKLTTDYFKRMLEARQGTQHVEATDAAPATAQVVPLHTPDAKKAQATPPKTDALAQLDTIQTDSTREALEDAIEALNREFFVSIEGGTVCIFIEGTNPETGLHELIGLSQAEFRLLHANRTVTTTDTNGNTKSANLADVWLRAPQRRQYPNGIALLPGMEAPEGVYNLWRGFGIEPDRSTKKAAPLLWHLRNVVCAGNHDHFLYLLGWMARCVQHPAKPAEVAIVMRGGRGTGKSTVGRWMCRLFGPHGMHVLHSRHLVGTFNAHLRGVCMLFADEAFFAGDRQGADVLKGLVTEPTLTIERKGVDAYTAPNRLKIMMASNSDWVVPAGIDERRYLVLDVSDCRKQKHAYFDKLHEQAEDGGLAALLHILMHHDTSTFNVRQVPSTSGLVDQKLLSLPAFDRWLYERLYSGAVLEHDNDWKHEQRREDVTGAFEQYVQSHGLGRYERTDAATVGRHLRAVFPELGETQHRETGSRNRYWVLPELDEARRQFERYALSGEHAPWPTD
ncbi:primase-helicase family protein [Denitromonas halophila]|uniref:NrS-1 polymerase-like helicase domain-containing protein n=1 Tax=Denitromonas halophila TaxID=1629404 RepID=A0A557QJJ1_9RHOO|nr:primase-helicase family protein [Denitromonas halophila]TVO53074.1 hypothetical protein FHP91_14815 [Denitromonas halophila]